MSRSRTEPKSLIQSKLVNLLTIGLVTLGWLAPAQTALGKSTEEQTSLQQVQHLVCVKEGEHGLCDVEKSSDQAQESAKNPAIPNQTKSTDSLHQSSTVNNFPLLLSPAQQETITNIILGFSYVVLPCGLALGIFLYDKYSAYRSTVLKEQIESLERLWKQSTPP